MKKNTKRLKIKVSVVAVVLVIISCIQLLEFNNHQSQAPSFSNQESMYFCLGDDEWENY